MARGAGDDTVDWREVGFEDVAKIENLWVVVDQEFLAERVDLGTMGVVPVERRCCDGGVFDAAAQRAKRDVGCLIYWASGLGGKQNGKWNMVGRGRRERGKRGHCPAVADRRRGVDRIVDRRQPIPDLAQ